MVAQLLNILEQLFNCSRTIFSHNTLSRLAKAFLRTPVVTLSDFSVRQVLLCDHIVVAWVTI